MITTFKLYENNSDLENYINGKYKLTPTINILMNDSTKDWYSLIGEDFFNNVDEDFFKSNKWIEKIKKASKKEKNKYYDFIGINFITSYLNEESLKNMFGEPICHGEFGEGFEPKRKYEYCSYFVDINNSKVHIGYDERGTTIEVEKGLTTNEVYEIIKVLIDKYNEI